MTLYQQMLRLRAELLERTKNAEADVLELERCGDGTDSTRELLRFFTGEYEAYFWALRRVRAIVRAQKSPPPTRRKARRTSAASAIDRARELGDD